jgi:hypothetical protein
MLAAPRIRSGLTRLGLLALLALAVLLVGYAGSAQGQTVADPDFWKQTVERHNTVNRFVYSQSPQPIPSAYDPVAEAEQILRQRQATLPPSNPQAPTLWQQVRGITVKTALSTPPRALGTISLAAGVFTVGWKAGSGINAKFLKFGVPDTSNAGPADYRWDRIVWTPALTRQWADGRWPAQDSWVIWARQTCCNYSTRDWWYNPECVASPYGFQPPEPFVIGGPVWSGSFCYNPAPPGLTDAFVYYASAPENALGAPAPIAPYTNQPYTYSTPAPTAPPQTTVEQSIDNELAKPENSLLRQWLNYQLGSPGEEDPLGIGEPHPDIDFPNREEKWQTHRHDFDPEHADAEEYWRDAADVIRKTNDGWPDFEKCVRQSDQAEIYWDPERETIVIVKDGKIDNFFPPRSPIDPGDTGYARRYFDSACAS